jgi:alpha-galactosidase
MLEVGNGGMTDDEYRAHFSLWGVMAAPLIAGNDLRSMSDATRAILTAPEVIAIDQDPLGRQGRRVARSGTTEAWARELADGSRAVLLLNGGDAPATVAAPFAAIGLATTAAHVRDLWERADLGPFSEAVSAHVRPHAAMLLKVSPR